MKFRFRSLVVASVAMLAADALTVRAQQKPRDIPASITTPDKVETRIGTMEFKDGMPSKETLDKVYDNLDFTHAFEAFVNTFQGVNMAAIREANADTVYFIGFIDLSSGPMVLETPPKALGTLDDFWWRWVIDFGAPGPDRGEGGKYLILPPGYDGPLPAGGYFIARSRTTRVAMLGRSFMEKDDPKPTVELIKKTAKISHAKE
jgi:hypothetical protein